MLCEFEWRPCSRARLGSKLQSRLLAPAGLIWDMRSASNAACVSIGADRHNAERPCCWSAMIQFGQEAGTRRLLLLYFLLPTHDSSAAPPPSGYSIPYLQYVVLHSNMERVDHADMSAGVILVLQQLCFQDRSVRKLRQVETFLSSSRSLGRPRRRPSTASSFQAWDQSIFGCTHWDMFQCFLSAVQYFIQNAFVACQSVLVNLYLGLIVSQSYVTLWSRPSYYLL
jgi:hypothetical protein